MWFDVLNIYLDICMEAMLKTILTILYEETEKLSASSHCFDKIS